MNMLVWPPGTYARWPGARAEHQINALGLGLLAVSLPTVLGGSENCLCYLFHVLLFVPSGYPEC